MHKKSLPTELKDPTQSMVNYFEDDDKKFCLVLIFNYSADHNFDSYPDEVTAMFFLRNNTASEYTGTFHNRDGGLTYTDGTGRNGRYDNLTFKKSASGAYTCEGANYSYALFFGLNKEITLIQKKPTAQEKKLTLDIETTIHSRKVNDQPYSHISTASPSSAKGVYGPGAPNLGR